MCTSKRTDGKNSGSDCCAFCANEVQKAAGSTADAGELDDVGGTGEGLVAGGGAGAGEFVAGGGAGAGVLCAPEEEEFCAADGGAPVVGAGAGDDTGDGAGAGALDGAGDGAEVGACVPEGAGGGAA